jgi:hypothetical protein
VNCVAPASPPTSSPLPLLAILAAFDWAIAIAGGSPDNPFRQAWGPYL